MPEQKITKAILPVAGFGTRFLPATKAQPKEMLSVVDKPVVQYIVEELVESGIKDIIFGTGRGKRALEDHFDISYELEDTLQQKNKTELMEIIKHIPHLARFTYVRQKTPKGDGDAILQAAHLIGNEPVVVVFGDCLYDSKVPPTKQLIASYKKYHAPIVGLAEIDPSEVSKFGVADGKKIDKDHIIISKFVEKPKQDEAPSNLVACGRYVITPETFRILEGIQKDNDEVRLADAFNVMLEKNKKLYGRIFEGEWLDTGDKFNFLKATIHFGLKHPEVGEKLRKYLKGLSL